MSQYVVIKTPSVNFKDDPLTLWLHSRRMDRATAQPSWHYTDFRSQSRKSDFSIMCANTSGKSLSQWMQDNPKPSIDTVREVVQQVCNAVRAMHRMDVLHQDIKPDNIMIDERDRVRLIDFGSARSRRFGVKPSRLLIPNCLQEPEIILLRVPAGAKWNGRIRPVFHSSDCL